MSEIKLGNSVKDVTTGFEGIVVTKLESLDGSVELGVIANSKSSDTRATPQYIPECYLNKIDDGVHITQIEKTMGFKPQ